MSRKRRNHSPEFKAKVALAAVKGDKTFAELSVRYQLHANQISQWKQELLSKASIVFDGQQAIIDKNSSLSIVKQCKILNLN